MTDMIDRSENCMRWRALRDPPANIDPYIPNLKPGIKPWKCYPPRYSLEQSKFGRKLVSEHIELDHWELCHDADYASPMRMVKKDSIIEPFRPTVDMQRVNTLIQPLQWPFPDVKTSLLQIAENGSKWFAVTDAKGGFFQMLIHERFQHIFCIMTDREVVKPKRLVQGNVNSAKWFGGQLASKLRDHIPGKILQWLDDFINHASTLDDLVDNWAIFFDICIKYNIKLSIKKTNLGGTSVHFVGHVLTKDGLIFEPSNYETILNMKIPEKGRELQQFVSCVNWMRESIPNFAQIVLPLTSILEAIYAEKGNRTKNGMNKYSLAKFGWDADANQSYINIKNSLANRIRLAIPKSTDTICVFTDASESGWCGTVTLVADFDPEQPIETLTHRPIAFLSGIFNDTQSRWGIQSKEAFAMWKTVLRMQHVTACFEFYMYTDSNNLSYIYEKNYQWAYTDLPRPAQDRLGRWLGDLAPYAYILKGISGKIMEEFCWSDMISRWANPEQHKVKPKVQRSKLMRTNINQKLAKLTRHTSFTNHGYSTWHDAFEWPTNASIKASQLKYLSDSSEPLTIVRLDCLYSQVNNSPRCWIPMKDEELRICLCILAHCGIAGHRSREQTEDNLADYFWSTMKEDLKEFCHTCLQCNQVKGGRTIPRPYGQVVTGTYRNECITFDYLYIEKPSSTCIHDFTYMLIIKDTFSHFIRLYPTAHADSTTTVKCLLDWVSIFGIPPMMLSDQGSHFKSKVVAQLAKSLGVQEHHFTVPHCPWGRGSIERVNLVVLDLLSMLTAETGQASWQWPYYTPSVCDIINSYESKTLSKNAPRMVMMNLPRTNALQLITHLPKSRDISSVDLNPRKIKKHLRSMDAALSQMHADVGKAATRRRKSNKKRQEKRAKIGSFTVGCFVLYAQVLKKVSSKIHIKWHGPYRVIECTNVQVYTIQHLLPHDITLEAHATRMKYYGHPSMNVTEILHQTNPRTSSQ